MNWCNSSTDSYSLDGRSEKLIFNINLLNSFIVYSFNIYIKYKINYKLKLTTFIIKALNQVFKAFFITNGLVQKTIL